METEYDAIVILDEPVKIRDDRGDVITIYGLLYNKDEKHKDDLWTWELNRYICYLQGCERVQDNGGRIAPEMIITAGQNMISLNVRMKNLIYRIMKEDMLPYRIIEYYNPIQLNPDEIEDNLVISGSVITRIKEMEL